jgi:hypothetical protein
MVKLEDNKRASKGNSKLNIIDRRIAIIAGLIFILISMILTTQNLTGNIILNSNSIDNYNIYSFIIFIIGILLTSIYFVLNKT